jgi:hypothetical protein
LNKYFKIGNRDDTLAWFAQAPNREMAIKVVEDLTGPQNPSRRIVTELPQRPHSYAAEGDAAQILTEVEGEE